MTENYRGEQPLPGRESQPPQGQDGVQTPGAQPVDPHAAPADPQRAQPADPQAPQPGDPQGAPAGLPAGPRFGPTLPPPGTGTSLPPRGTGPYEPLYPAFGPATPAPPPEPPHTRTGNRRTIVIAAVTAALVGAGVGAGVTAATDSGGTTTVTALPQTTQTAPATAKLDGTISAAAKKIQPSVVTVDVAGQSERGNGSGVILRKNGYIVTNDHVVSVAAGGGTITVITNDGQRATASIVGRDPSDDLAVIKVDGLKNLVPATFAQSSKLVVGQTVIAVGAPLGLSDTVTSGIVSNTARPVRSGDSDQAVFDAVQTDAAINPGNSGGALADLNGNVVGINAAIATPNTGGLQIPGQDTQSGNIGIGFAIPSDEVSRIAAQLISTGHATHAVLGITVSSRNAQPNTTGATIVSVDPGSGAAKGGLKADDVITVLNSQRVDDADALIAAVRSHAPGQTVTVTYTRDGKTATTHVTLGSATN